MKYYIYTYSIFASNERFKKYLYDKLKWNFFVGKGNEGNSFTLISMPTNRRFISVRGNAISPKAARSIERRGRNPINENPFSPPPWFFSSNRVLESAVDSWWTESFERRDEHQRTFLYAYAELGNRKMTFMRRAV